jgi:hypothetical protein
MQQPKQQEHEISDANFPRYQTILATNVLAIEPVKRD